jgi:hypothetical protein
VNRIEKEGGLFHSRTSYLKGHAFGLVFLKPGVRGDGIRKYLKVSGSPTCLLLVLT